MNIKKYISLIAVLATLGSFVLAIPAFAQWNGGGQGGFGGTNGGQPPAVFGTVSAISGTTLTVTSNAGPNGGTATTYTVDASNATFTKSGQASSVSAIAVGDTVVIQGTVSGTSVTATSIRDIQFGMRGGSGRMPGVIGTISAISGTTLTVTGSQGFGSTTPTTTYTVDASNATVTKNNSPSTLANISVGDTVVIQGTVSGTNVTATTIRDGIITGVARGPRQGKPGIAGPNKKPAAGSKPKPAGMGIRGTVSAISGTILTVTGSQGFSTTTAATTYTVDASNATVFKSNATSTVANIAVGDTIMVQGTVSGTNVTATTIRDGATPVVIRGNGEPVVAGSVTAISGNIITITNKSNVTYTIDATNASFVVAGVTSPTISNVAMGDNLVVQGTINGTSVTASSVIDQKAPATANTGNSNGNQQPQPGILGGITSSIGQMFGGVGNFFKHIFGF